VDAYSKDVVQLSFGRRKWIVLVAFLIVVVFGFLAFMMYFVPRREYILLREVPVTTYYLRTETRTATLTKTTILSSAALSTVTKASLIAPITLTRYDPRTVNWTATYTDTVVTVMDNTTYAMLTRTLVHTYVFTTSVPVTYVHGIPTVISETTTQWVSVNRTLTLTTTITSTISSTSVYTRTVWTTATAPPGGGITSPQSQGLMEMALCSALLAGVIAFRRRSSPLISTRK